MTTSRPAASSRRAASSMAKVLPTPGHMPRKTLSLPRFFAASSRWSELNSASGLGRLYSGTTLFTRVQVQVQLQNVQVRSTIGAALRPFTWENAESSTCQYALTNLDCAHEQSRNFGRIAQVGIGRSPRNL